ncbi:MAG: hypothetical protein JWO36_1758 [Myxococcales bacterium]|nr:hypothetical protein [Myxococcales bacterium]
MKSIFSICLVLSVSAAADADPCKDAQKGVAQKRAAVVAAIGDPKLQDNAIEDLFGDVQTADRKASGACKTAYDPNEARAWDKGARHTVELATTCQQSRKLAANFTDKKKPFVSVDVDKQSLRSVSASCLEGLLPYEGRANGFLKQCVTDCRTVLVDALGPPSAKCKASLESRDALLAETTRLIGTADAKDVDNEWPARDGKLQRSASDALKVCVEPGFLSEGNVRERSLADNARALMAYAKARDIVQAGKANAMTMQMTTAECVQQFAYVANLEGRMIKLAGECAGWSDKAKKRKK